MYELDDASMPQRFMLSGCVALWAAAALWLLFGGGVQTAGHWFGRAWSTGDPVRRGCLAAALLIYYVRILRRLRRMRS